MSRYWWVTRKEDVNKLVKADIDDVVPFHCMTRDQLSAPSSQDEAATVELRVTQKWEGTLDDKHGGPMVCLQGQLDYTTGEVEVRVYGGYSRGIAILQVA
jgi:hypothetical protein